MPKEFFFDWYDFDLIRFSSLKDVLNINLNQKIGKSSCNNCDDIYILKIFCTLLMAMVGWWLMAMVGQPGQGGQGGLGGLVRVDGGQPALDNVLLPVLENDIPQVIRELCLTTSGTVIEIHIINLGNTSGSTFLAAVSRNANSDNATGTCWLDWMNFIWRSLWKHLFIL